IMLLLLTIIGVTSMQTTTLEEKMAGNMHEYHLAFQSAEAALREGEKYLEDTALITTDSTDGIHDRGDAPLPLDESTWTDTAQWRDVSSVLDGLQGSAGYSIEKIGTVSKSTGKNVGFTQNYASNEGGDVTGWRVVAWGKGRNDTVKVVLSSYFGKKTFENAN
ncbi:MAG: PilX N-terminal domain-containing pilus assembly protein, partial [Granulosicoccaceae bacterium]